MTIIIIMLCHLIYLHRLRKTAYPDFNPGLHEDLYAFWAAGVVGLILHILATIHALLWGKTSYVIGSIVSIYTMHKLCIYGYNSIVYKTVYKPEVVP